ncbi:penicillin acylase family protein, partial [Candidatus Sumerlaeota bacterium]|nr:penicillin acylase family protein [Candidatus Sumerlaeota bacterium]
MLETRSFCRLIAVCALSALAAGIALGGSPEDEKLAQSVTIYRDKWGIPHIDAPTDAGAAFGFAYAQAEDFFWQVEDTYAQSIGRYAEIEGEAGVESDLLNHAFEVVSKSKADYEIGDPDIRALAQGFTGGLNWYLEHHPETKPRLITHFEPWMVLCYERHILMTFLYGQTHFSKGENTKVHQEWRDHIGSNGWAIGPSRTKAHTAMLYCNPHQPWFGFGQFYEAHMRSSEGMNFSGATLFGGPVLTIGHNEYLGWTHTVNDPDVADVWIETFDDPANPLHYKYGGEYKTATEWKDTIKVNTKGGMDERTYPFRKTHHGPVVGKKDDTHYFSANIAKLMDGNRARQALKMVKSHNLTEFKEAMSLLNLNMFNTIYADKDGNIYYLYNGAIPKRDPGFDWQHPVDGSDPRTEWGELHPLTDLPQVVNPPSAFVQNCNSSPFTTTDDGNPFISEFPPYMVEEKNSDWRRAKMSRHLLRGAHDMTFEDWQKLALDTTLYWPMNELPRYKERFEELKKTDPDMAAKVEPYLNFLLDWDCKSTNESAQTTLCVEWYNQMYDGFYPAENFKKVYQNDWKMRFDALLISAEKLKRSYGDWKVAWGETRRIQRHPNVADMVKIPFSDGLPSVPCPGVNGPLGVAMTIYYSPPLFGRKKYYGVVGCSYMGAFEFGEKVKAASLTQFGASSDPKSPHFADQAEMLSKKQFKPAWFYWDEVEANTVVKYHP